MDVGTYQHLPVQVQAVQLTAHNAEAVADWCGGELCGRGHVLVPTIDGQRPARVGDWIIRRNDPPEFYKVTADVFANSYGPADHDTAVAAGVRNLAADLAASLREARRK